MHSLGRAMTLWPHQPGFSLQRPSNYSCSVKETAQNFFDYFISTICIFRFIFFLSPILLSMAKAETGCLCVCVYIYLSLYIYISLYTHTPLSKNEAVSGSFK